MKRAGLAVLIVCLGLFLSAEAHAEGAFRLGGGVHFDEDLPGVSVAVDIPIGEGNLAFGPFGDYHFKGGSRVAAAGVNLLVRRPAGSKAWMYIGAGGGIGNVKSENDWSDGTIRETLEAKKTQTMANAVVGFDYATTERASMFIQLRWMGMFGGDGTEVAVPTGESVTADLDVKALSAHVGLAIHFGERAGDFDY